MKHATAAARSRQGRLITMVWVAEATAGGLAMLWAVGPALAWVWKWAATFLLIGLWVIAAHGINLVQAVWLP